MHVESAALRCTDLQRNRAVYVLHTRLTVRSLICALAAVIVPALVFAQDTRAGLIATEQAAKARRLAPPSAHWAEQLILSARQSIIDQPSGFYPYFDSVYSGGGFTLGAGYRQFTGDRAHVNLSGLYSVSGYKLIELNVVAPGHWSGRLDLRGTAGWRDATQVSFYGLGIDSPADNNAAYRMQQSYAGGDVTMRPQQWLRLTAAVTAEDFSIQDPTGDFISVESEFTEAAAPGVGTDPFYLHTAVSAAIDTRPAADYARRGALYQVAHHHYADRDQAYSFSRLDGEIVQHIPILRENWVLSLHGRVESVIDDGDQVPYFLLPALGSGSTLRGYSSWRFRDRHAVLFAGEWRWIANRLALDMALFYDAGMVAPRLDAITTNGFVSNYGVGVRFHSPVRTPLRVELARGREGTRVVFSASAAF